MEINSVKILTDELLSDPEKFFDQGKAYILLQEYFKGYPLKTLRVLLNHKDPMVQKSAIWVTSELGREAYPLICEAIHLIDSDERYIQYHALEIVMVCSFGENANKFIHVVRSLKCDDEVIRILVMRLISNADIPRLEAGIRQLKPEDPTDKIHLHGLRCLLEIDKFDEKRVVQMLDAPDPLLRKYGAIAAKILSKKYSGILEYAVSSNDSDICRFSKSAIRLSR